MTVKLLQFSKLESYQKFSNNPDNEDKRGVYVWGFCFDDLKGFKPYYVGKAEKNIIARLKEHVKDINEGTHKILHKDILKNAFDYRKVRNNSYYVVYDHAIYNKQNNNKFFPKINILEPSERAKLLPHVKYYIDNLYVTYLEVNGLDLGTAEDKFIIMLERYIQEKLRDRSISRKTGSFDKEFSSNIAINTSVGTEHLDHYFNGGDSYLPSHDPYRDSTPIVKLKHQPHLARVQLCCKVSTLKEMSTKNGKLIGWATVEDVTGSVEVIVFADNYMAVSDLLKSDEVLRIGGKVDQGEHGPKILLESLSVI